MKVLGGGYLNSGDLRRLGIRSVGENVMVHERAILVDLDNIEIGSNVRIDAFCVLSAAGGHLRLGSYIHIASHADIYAGAGVTMDDFSGLSQGVRVYSITDDYSGESLTNPTVPKQFVRAKKGQVHLGRHTIIGSGSVILPGVTIGDGSSVGALSLVAKSLDPWGVYVGSPVKWLKARSQRLIEDELKLLDIS